MPLNLFTDILAQCAFNGDMTFWSTSFTVEDVLKISAQYSDIHIEAHAGGYSFDWTEQPKEVEK